MLIYLPRPVHSPLRHHIRTFCSWIIVSPPIISAWQSRESREDPRNLAKAPTVTWGMATCKQSSWKRGRERSIFWGFDFHCEAQYWRVSGMVLVCLQIADPSFRKSLSDTDAQVLLQTLIGWLIRRLENGEGALVVRKLCSTLVAYFLQFSSVWTKCVKHLMYCLCSGLATPYRNLEDSPEDLIQVHTLTPDQAIIVFWFASSLVEEVGKTDSNSMKQLSLVSIPFPSWTDSPFRHKFHKHVVPNADAIVPLIRRYISVDSSAVDTKVRQEAMKCFQVCHYSCVLFFPRPKTCFLIYWNCLFRFIVWAIVLILISRHGFRTHIELSSTMRLYWIPYGH